MSSETRTRKPRGTTLRLFPAVLCLWLCGTAAWAQETPAEAAESRSLETIQDEIRARQDQTARTLAAVGRLHLSQGRYEDALTALARAAELAPESSAIRLTLGTAQFRAGRYAEARDTLLEALEEDPNNLDALLLVALSRIELEDLDGAAADLAHIGSVEGPLRSLAQIQLGRVLGLQGDFKGAREALHTAILTAPDEKTEKQARDMLALVEHRIRAARPYRLSAAVGGLYDDNVVTTEIDTTSGRRDGAAEFELSGGYKYDFEDESSVGVGYDFFQSVYGEVSSFDLQTHTATLGGTKKLTNFDASANYAFTRALLDNDRLFDSHRFATPLATFPVASWYLLVTPSATLKSFENGDRDAVQGSLDMTHFYFLPERKGWASLALGYDNENASARRFDYNAFRLRIGFRLPVSNWFEFDARYKFRLRDYTGVTPSIAEERLDETHTARVTLSRELGRGFELFVSYEHEHADSNLESADYVQNHVRLKIEWSL